MTERLSPNGAPRPKRSRADRPFGNPNRNGQPKRPSGPNRAFGSKRPSTSPGQPKPSPIVRVDTPPLDPKTVRGDESFAELGVPEPIIASLAFGGVTEPFPIQSATLPDALAGRDVLGRGQTGSGKTIAFAIPTVVALARSAKQRQPFRPRGMILVPTRELANQVADTVKPIAHPMGLRITTVFGGVSQHGQVSALRSGVDIVIACPGRLEDLIQQDLCRLSHVEITVLDEADHMADLGFLPGVKRLLEATPKHGQRLLFSATLDNAIDVLVDRFLHDPIIHSVNPAVAPVDTMTHHVFAIASADKGSVAKELASGRGRTLLFMRTKHAAKKMAQHLTKSGIPAVDLHGNLSQNARERNLASFSAGTTKVLVATDIAARGIHVDDVSLVVHVDPPSEHKAYLHRSGRTARAGSDGIVITLMTPDQTADVKGLTKAAKIEPTITRVTPGHELIREIVGEPAEFVAPTPIPDRPPLSKPSRPPKGHNRQQGTAQKPAEASPRSARTQQPQNRQNAKAAPSAAKPKTSGQHHKARAAAKRKAEAKRFA